MGYFWFSVPRDHGCELTRLQWISISRLDLRPGWDRCVVFLGKILYLHHAYLHPGV